MKTAQQLATEAAEAHSNLNFYGAVIALLESGLLYGGRDGAAQKLIRICKAEQQKELARHDAAMSDLGAYNAPIQARAASCPSPGSDGWTAP